MSSKAFAILLPLLVTVGASAAFADDKCTGTLCDWYYGTSSSFDDKPAAPAKAPTPMTAPSGGLLGMFSGSSAAARSATPGAAASGAPAAAPAKRPLVGVGGGGLAAMARGEAPERCSGTLCDFYYGKSSSFDDEKPAAAAAQPSAQASAEVAADAPAPAEPLEMTGFQTRPEPARCAAKGRDPWSCYR